MKYVILYSTLAVKSLQHFYYLANFIKKKEILSPVHFRCSFYRLASCTIVSENLMSIILLLIDDEIDILSWVLVTINRRDLSKSDTAEYHVCEC